MGLKQYTIRNVPNQTDQALRRKARERGKSLNATILEELSRVADESHRGNLHHDLDDLIGSWEEDVQFDQTVEAFEVVDEGLWR